MVSLNTSLSVAAASLQAIQVQTSVTANNIANADTDGYTRKIAAQSTSVSGGQAAGVTIGDLSSQVDRLLVKRVTEATTAAAAAEVTATYASALSSLMGTSDDAVGTLGSSLDALESALTALEATPEDTTLKAQAVAALDDVTARLRDLSAGAQGLRADADQEIEDTVAGVNSALHAIDDFNDAIRRATAAGQSTAALEDQRQSALDQVASALAVTSFVTDSGDLKVYTNDGTPLVDSSVHTLEFDAANTMTPDTTLGAGLSGITVDGVDITAEVRSGSLAALVEQRDEVLPALQAELDALASALVNGINAAVADGTAVPAPATLTGTMSVSATDALSTSGTLRVVVTDAAGTTQDLADIDLSTLGSVGDLMTALSGVPGVSATLDAEGHLVVSTTASDTGIVLGGASALSESLGLGAALTGDGAEDIRVADWLTDDPSLLATGTVDDASGLAAGDPAIFDGDASGVARLAAVLTSNVSFPATGDLSAVTDTPSGYAGAILGGVAMRLSAAEQVSTTTQATLAGLEDRLSSQSGVNLDEETVRLEELQTSYQASSTLISALREMFDTLLDAVA